MNSITAIIITKNEEKNIKRCIDSLRTVADEIIVVDSYSTDNTVAICQQEGVRLITQEWLGYGTQKNAGNKAASHDYILSLDADEALDKELKASILAAKREGLHGIYDFSRLNYYFGKFLRHGLEYPDYKIRLFPKDSLRWNDDLVHEALVVSAHLPKKRLKGHLLHYTYFTIQEHVAKANRYSSLSAELYQKKGKSTVWFKIILGPVFTFLQAYVFKGGFLDGAHGFIVASCNAYGTFLKYAKLWQLNNETKE